MVSGLIASLTTFFSFDFFRISYSICWICLNFTRELNTRCVCVYVCVCIWCSTVPVVHVQRKNVELKNFFMLFWFKYIFLLLLFAFLLSTITFFYPFYSFFCFTDDLGDYLLVCEKRVSSFIQIFFTFTSFSLKIDFIFANCGLI